MPYLLIRFFMYKNPLCAAASPLPVHISLRICYNVVQRNYSIPQPIFTYVDLFLMRLFYGKATRQVHIPAVSATNSLISLVVTVIACARSRTDQNRTDLPL